MKVRLKKEIADKILRENGAWTSFNSVYDNSLIAYNKDFLGIFDVKETNRFGRYTIMQEGRSVLNHCTVFLDHIDVVPEHSFKEDIFRILEI